MHNVQLVFRLLVALLFFSPPIISTVAAEQLYVQPNVDIPVRRGRGTKYKIIKLVTNGEQVELLKETDTWAKIQVKGGTVGWLPRRYLTVEPPPRKLVKLLRKENSTLLDRDKQLTRELEKLKDLHSRTDSELSSCIAERDALASKYKQLQLETADVVAINTQIAATKKEMEQMQATMHTVKLQNKELKRKTAVTWFLSGGGVLFVGWIIGLITCRAKRRRSSLL